MPKIESNLKIPEPVLDQIELEMLATGEKVVSQVRDSLKKIGSISDKQIVNDNVDQLPTLGNDLINLDKKRIYLDFLQEIREGSIGVIPKKLQKNQKTASILYSERTLAGTFYFDPVALGSLEISELQQFEGISNRKIFQLRHLLEQLNELNNEQIATLDYMQNRPAIRFKNEQRMLLQGISLTTTNATFGNNRTGFSTRAKLATINRLADAPIIPAETEWQSSLKVEEQHYTYTDLLYLTTLSWRFLTNIGLSQNDITVIRNTLCEIILNSE
jgi:hypothetical protein